MSEEQSIATATKKKKDPFAIWGFVVGIVSVFFRNGIAANCCDCFERYWYQQNQRAGNGTMDGGGGACSRNPLFHSLLV